MHVVGVDSARLFWIDRAIDHVVVIAVTFARAVLAEHFHAHRPLIVLGKLLDLRLERAPMGPLGKQLPHVPLGERDAEFLVAIGTDPNVERHAERLADVDLLLFAFQFDEQQVTRLTFRGDELERLGGERLAVGADVDRRDLKSTRPRRCHSERINDADILRHRAIDPRNVGALRRLAQ